MEKTMEIFFYSGRIRAHGKIIELSGFDYQKVEIYSKWENIWPMLSWCQHQNDLVDVEIIEQSFHWFRLPWHSGVKADNLFAMEVRRLAVHEL